MRALNLSVLLLIAHIGLPASASAQGVRGYWREPGGSVIHIDTCGSAVCATLVAISAQAPSREDTHNPDPALRRRSLCGLQIGTGFTESGDTAEGGQLYDPKSGKTYHGTLRRKGETLLLRGYVGLPLFGRTESWQHSQPVTTCSK